MKKFFAISLAIALLCACPALAESGAWLDWQIFLAVGEGDGAALIMARAIDENALGGMSATIAERADAISSLVEFEGKIYYLRLRDGRWNLVSRDADGYTDIAYEFPEGALPRDLSVGGEYLYALLDDQLHVIYPSTHNCFLLANVKMQSYVIIGDFVYFSSMNDEIEYVNGDARHKAGCLYQMNINTVVRKLLVKSGVEDIQYANSKLYFRNFSDNYRMVSESGETLRGKLFSYDLETGALENLGFSYDWQFFATEKGVIVRQSDGLYTNERKIAAVPAEADAMPLGDDVCVIDYSDIDIYYVEYDGTRTDIYPSE